MRMNVQIGDYEVDSIILDLGSDINIQTKQTYILMGKPTLWLLSPKINLFWWYEEFNSYDEGYEYHWQFESLCFFIWVKISQVVAFGGLGEDQNISLATESWKINNRWKTPSAIRHIAKFFSAIGTFLNSDRRCSPLLRRCFRVLASYGTAIAENLVIESSKDYTSELENINRR